jgi:hypothetical protein
MGMYQWRYNGRGKEEHFMDQPESQQLGSYLQSDTATDPVLLYRACGMPGVSCLLPRDSRLLLVSRPRSVTTGSSDSAIVHNTGA